MYDLSPIERKIIKVLLKGVPKTREELLPLNRDKDRVNSAISHLYAIKFIKYKTENLTSQSGEPFSHEGNRFIIYDKNGCEHAIKSKNKQVVNRSEERRVG